MEEDQARWDLEMQASPNLSHTALPHSTAGTDAETAALLSKKTPSSSASYGAGFELIQTKEETIIDDETRDADLGSAVFNLATTIIGAGIMALPATMRVLGLPLGLISIFGMGLLSQVSVQMVVDFSTQLKAWTYGDMVYGACGWAAKLIAQMCIVINNSGILIVYLIIMGDVMSGSSNHVGLFEQWCGRSGWWNDRRIVMLITMLLVVGPLSSLRRIDSLKFSSAASVALAVVFVLVISGVAIAKGVEGELDRPKMLPSLSSKKSILELLTVVPIMCNAFICHFNIQPIYCELKNKTAARMNKVGRISNTLCVIVYAATALSGYLLFGEATSSDILSNFDRNLGIAYSTLLNNIIRIGYVVHLMLVFPVINFSLRQNVDAIIFPQAQVALAESGSRYVITTCMLLGGILLGSTMIPNIWIAFQFTGATSGLSLGFIFPALVALRMMNKSSRGKETVAWVMLILATVSSFLGVFTNIYNIVTHNID